MCVAVVFFLLFKYMWTSLSFLDLQLGVRAGVVLYFAKTGVPLSFVALELCVRAAVVRYFANAVRAHSLFAL